MAISGLIVCKWIKTKFPVQIHIKNNFRYLLIHTTSTSRIHTAMAPVPLLYHRLQTTTGSVLSTSCLLTNSNNTCTLYYISSSNSNCTYNLYVSSSNSNGTYTLYVSSSNSNGAPTTAWFHYLFFIYFIKCLISLSWGHSSSSGGLEYGHTSRLQIEPYQHYPTAFFLLFIMLLDLLEYRKYIYFYDVFYGFWVF